MNEKLIAKTKKFPDAPGVYFWLGPKKEILYIGRATNLKKRVAQYFRKDIEPRIAEMTRTAADIKYQITETILDSVILEANLIKKHWPKYNIKDKDDRSFVYVVFTDDDYPRPLIVRERELNKFPAGRGRIFGPYQNATMLKNALRLVRRIFPYSTCRPGQGRPCFDHQVGLCPGICVEAISRADYQRNISNLILLFAGKKKRLIAKLKKDHPERAAALSRLQDVTLITADEAASTRGVNRIEGYDISHLSGRETYGAMAVLTGGEPDKSQYRLFKIKTAPAGDDLAALGEMIIRRLSHTEWPRPDLIMIDGGKPQVDYVVKIFRARNVSIPLVGISKFGGDKLVFPSDTKKPIKELAEASRKQLLKVRDEAHRFGNRASRQKRRKFDRKK